MSREIKFRAWLKPRWEDDEDSNKMYYDIQNSYDNLGDVKPFDAMNSFANWLDSEVAVIEQYTGLKDKNGKEIYEGDIVKAKIQGFWETGPNTICEGKATWNLEVVYNEIRYMDVFHILGSKNAPDRIYYLFDDKLSDIEVIGNIHENPELLGGE